MSKRQKSTYYFSTEQGRKHISELASLPLMCRENKGIYAWHIGNNKFRIVLSKKGRHTHIEYCETFEQAVEAYLEAHEERFGELPHCNYRHPKTGKLIYRGEK